MDKQGLLQGIGQFTGTEQYFKHWTGMANYTDGIKFVIDSVPAAWLVDKIITTGRSRAYKFNQDFQIWYLVVRHKQATLLMKYDSGQGQKKQYEEKITYTNFPTGVWKFYMIDGVLLLPTEY